MAIVCDPVATNLSSSCDQPLLNKASQYTSHSRTGGIDKLELRIPRAACFTSEFHRVFLETFGRRRGWIREGYHYRSIVDLRRAGLQALLHLECKRDAFKHSKLEFLNIGRLSRAQILATIESIYDCDAQHLQIMRLDLCADCVDVPVLWFHTHVSVRRKRSTAILGMTVPAEPVSFAVRHNGRGMTLHYGNTPHGFRIYDKTAERLQRFARLRRVTDDKQTLDFRQLFGHDKNDVITRVECHYRGGRIPPDVRLLRQLFANAADLNPFEPLAATPVASYMFMIRPIAPSISCREWGYDLGFPPWGIRQRGHG